MRGEASSVHFSAINKLLGSSSGQDPPWSQVASSAAHIGLLLTPSGLQLCLFIVPTSFSFPFSFIYLLLLVVLRVSEWLGCLESAVLHWCITVLARVILGMVCPPPPPSLHSIRLGVFSG